jgi:hypothetical protein
MFCATGASFRAVDFSALRSAFRESCQMVLSGGRKVKKMTDSACKDAGRRQRLRGLGRAEVNLRSAYKVCSPQTDESFAGIQW